jgi:hypothetical protein
MRNVLIAAVIIATISFDARSVKAQEGPWCAILNFGSDVSEDCEYRSFEDCRPNVLAGNRGFCNPNPRWGGWYGPSERRHYRKHYSRQY